MKKVLIGLFILGIGTASAGDCFKNVIRHYDRRSTIEICSGVSNRCFQDLLLNFSKLVQVADVCKVIDENELNCIRNVSRHFAIDESFEICNGVSNRCFYGLYESYSGPIQTANACKQLLNGKGNL